MAYRLKQIHYQTKPSHILLQNENGPCPLLAAANCLLLTGSISLPSNCIGAGVVTIDQLVNVLAEKILMNQTGSHHHIQEVMTVFPNLQYGMDVNPKFTSGPTGVEYTMGLNAFDMLHIELVHGWLIEPDAEEYNLIENQTYNQLINVVIEGNEASSSLQQNPDVINHDELSTKATKGSIVHHFLERSSHQLTQYGLTELHQYLRDGQMVVFFRNNHFNTLTKHDGLLYLLVTDFGYVNVSSVVWEKLDVIDGDTEYVGDNFMRPTGMGHNADATAATTGEQMMANNLQSQADYQLALQLSQEVSGAPNASRMPPQKDPQMEAARQASLMQHQSTVSETSNVSAASAPPASGTPPSTTPTPTDSSNAPTHATVAVGIPAQTPTQEQQDLMLAMQLQRQEEKERERRQAEGRQSRQAAGNARQQRQEGQEHRVSQQAPPPRPQPTVPVSSRKFGNKDNCVIS